ncbi:hypothetical protein TW65_06103 [Stemphylium lycopersici]|nr:hypothetical protein TW65_06103 [Stemphylium lycopersici]
MEADKDSKAKMEELLKDLRTQEIALIARCDEKQRQVVILLAKGHYISSRLSYVREWGTGAENRERIGSHVRQRDYRFAEAAELQFDLGPIVNKLRRLTAVHKTLQTKLGLAPTAEEYIDFGDDAELGKRFLLVNHEVDSSTSVRHYMDERMAGSSLFANELP